MSEMAKTKRQKEPKMVINEWALGMSKFCGVQSLNSWKITKVLNW